MHNPLYDEALRRVERRLSHPIRLSAHAILFSVVSVIAAFSNLTSYAYIPDGSYWGLYFWGLALVAHGVYAYRRSGLSKSRREQVIQEELLAMSAAYDLTLEEMVDLHDELAREAAVRAVPLRWTLGTIAGYQAVWQGFIGAGLLSTMMGGYLTNDFVEMLRTAPFVGAGVLGFVLLLVTIWGRRSGEDSDVRSAYLHAVYSTKLEKAKRAASQRLAVDDEGEIILQDAGEMRRKRG
ncbi:MAG: 2TM domain-containing protein [Anaerolineae bacterium]